MYFFIVVIIAKAGWIAQGILRYLFSFGKNGRGNRLSVLPGESAVGAGSKPAPLPRINNKTDNGRVWNPPLHVYTFARIRTGAA